MVMSDDHGLGERVAVLETNSFALFKKLDEVVEQLKVLNTFYARSQGFTKATQLISYVAVLLIGWMLKLATIK